MNEAEKELQFYKSNPKQYAKLVKQIANLKTTDEGFLERKRKLIQGAKERVLPLKAQAIKEFKRVNNIQKGNLDEWKKYIGDVEND